MGIIEKPQDFARRKVVVNEKRREIMTATETRHYRGHRNASLATSLREPPLWVAFEHEATEEGRARFIEAWFPKCASMRVWVKNGTVPADGRNRCPLWMFNSTGFSFSYELLSVLTVRQDT